MSARSRFIPAHTSCMSTLIKLPSCRRAPFLLRNGAADADLAARRASARAWAAPWLVRLLLLSCVQSTQRHAATRPCSNRTEPACLHVES